MDFTLNTSEGFLNTDIAIKTFEMESLGSYQIRFSDGSSIEGLNGDTIIYKKFSSAGDYDIKLEYGNLTVCKSIRIIDTLVFGNGKTLGYELFDNRNIIIQRKSTGLLLYYCDIGKAIFMPFLPDQFFEIDNTRIAFIKSDTSRAITRIGFFELENASVVIDTDARGGFINLDDGLLCFYTDSNINIIKDGAYLDIEGEFLLKHKISKGIFYKKANDIVYLSFSPFCSSLIRDVNKVESTAAPNLFIVPGNDESRIWNADRRGFIMKILDHKYTFMSDDSFIDSDVSRYMCFHNPDGNRDCLFDNPITTQVINHGKHRLIIYPGVFYTVSRNNSYSISSELTPHKLLDVFFDDLLHYQTNKDEYILYSVSTGIKIETSKKVVHGFRYQEKSILVSHSEGKVLFYQIKEDKLDIVATFDGEYDCDDESDNHLIDADMLWIKTGNKSYSVYRDLTDVLLMEFTYIKRFGYWFQRDDYWLLNGRSLEVKELFEPIEMIRDDTSEALVVRSDGTYLISLNQDHPDQLIFPADIIYEKAEIMPDGKMIVLDDGMNTILQPLDSNNPIILEKTDYIELDDGQVIVKDANGYSRVRVIDQSNYELVNNESVKYYGYVYTNKNGSLRSRSWGGYNTYCDSIEIVERDTGKSHKIPIQSRPQYINYISFSPDDNFVALGGKSLVKNEGVVEILSLSREGTALEGSTTARDSTYLAVWKVIFSPVNTLIAFYDSSPTSYVYKLGNNGSIWRKYTLTNRSTECFSPDGKFLVLSQHRYESTTIGGRGWCPSPKVFLANAETGTEIKEFNEHTTQVVYANISKDGDKMITRSEDGIVVVRSLRL